MSVAGGAAGGARSSELDYTSVKKIYYLFKNRTFLTVRLRFLYNQQQQR